MSSLRPLRKRHAPDSEDEGEFSESDSGRVPVVPFGRRISPAESRGAQAMRIDNMGPVIQGEAGFVDPPRMPLDVDTYRFMKSVPAPGPGQADQAPSVPVLAENEVDLSLGLSGEMVDPDADLRAAMEGAEAKAASPEEQAVFSGTPYCHLCEYRAPSDSAVKPEALKEIEAIFARRNEGVGAAYIVRDIYRVYNAQIRPLTGKDWTIETIDAHLRRHSVSPLFLLKDVMAQVERMINITASRALEMGPDGAPQINAEAFKAHHQLAGRVIDLCKAAAVMEKTKE